VFTAGAPRTDLGTVTSAGLSLSPDGRYLVTVNSQDRLELRLASGDTFGAAMPITEINAAAFDSQPSITPDGRTLYFSRRSSANVYDIWSATRR
jgi:Tol biopolymer transport system component